MLSRSDLRSPNTSRSFALAFVALFVVASPVLSSLVTTNIFVVSDEEPIGEDVYVTSTRGIVEGTINGDLTIFTGDLYVSGTVTGSIQMFSSGTVTVAQGANIGGSIRGVAANIEIFGSVADDLFVTAASVVVEESGVIGRDVMAFGGVVRVEGTVGRDVRGRSVRTVIDGTVAGDVDVATQRFEVGNGAVIGGDVQYRSPSDGSISSGAQVTGTVTRLPTQSNFIYGVILALANIIGFLGFIVAGVVALFVARGSGSRAAGAVITNPIKTFLWGLGTVIVAPFVTVLVAATLVGLPLAVLMAMVMVAGLILGPVPAVTALGNRVLIRRGGLFGAFVVGAILWRLSIWLVPLVGGVLYVLALVWGVGAWIVGILAARKADPLPMALMPASMIPDSGVPDDWEPPFAPLAAGAVEVDGEDVRVEDVAEDSPTRDGEMESSIAPTESQHAASSADDPRTSQEPSAIEAPAGDEGQESMDAAARRRAEFEALLDSAMRDDGEEDPSEDEWGLPSS